MRMEIRYDRIASPLEAGGADRGTFSTALIRRLNSISKKFFARCGKNGAALISSLTQISGERFTAGAFAIKAPLALRRIVVACAQFSKAPTMDSCWVAIIPCGRHWD